MINDNIGGEGDEIPPSEMNFVPNDDGPLAPVEYPLPNTPSMLYRV